MRRVLSRGGRAGRTPAASGVLPKAVQAAQGGVQSEHELRLRHRSMQAGLPAPTTQVRAEPGSRRRWDLGWPLEVAPDGTVTRWLLVEIHGGIWMAMRAAQTGTPIKGHANPKRVMTDIDKRTAALLAGHIQLDVYPEMIADGRAVAHIRTLYDRYHAA